MHPGQWEFQDPKMEVLYHISGHLLGGYSLKFRPYIGLIYGRYLQFRFLEWPLTRGRIVEMMGKMGYA